ncbi:MAG: Fn3-like domain-containing protein [Oscillospiraceae bacterium]|nr:Fn3-like domain-containing protein [Oscillospiraceae bacterium]
MKTPAIFVGSDGKSKLSLSDGIDDSFTLDFTVKNLTDTAVTYDSVTLDVLTDGYQDDGDGNYYVVPDNAVRLTVLDSDAPKSVTVDANSETEVSITVTLDSDELAANSEIFTNGFYIDGFVTLAVSGESDIPTISMPFTGFHGDWTSVPIFDNTMYDEGGSVLYDASTTNLAGTYLYSHLASGGTTYYYNLGVDANGEYNRDMIAISPNGDGMADSVGLLFTSWRAVKNLTLELTGGDFDIVRTSSSVFSKYMAAVFGPAELKRLDEMGLPDGDYTLTVSGEFNYDGAETESFELPVTIDRVAPKVMGASIDGDTLYVSASDNNYLYFVDIIYTDGRGRQAVKTSVPDAEKGGEYTAEFDISGWDTNDITISVYDMALNSTEIELSNAVGTVIANMTDYTAVENMTAATVELNNTGDSAVNGDAVIAFYDEDGALIAAGIQSVSIGAAETVEYDFEMFADTQNAASAKLFIWDGVSDMRPLDIVKSFDLSK